MAQISIAEIQTNFMPNANHLCETWSYEEYLEHQRNKIIDQSLSNITCTIFNLKDIMDPKKVSLPMCNTRESAAKTFQFQIEYILSLTGDKSPCSKTSYEYIIEYYSKNSCFDPTDADFYNSNYFHLMMYFKKLDTEERTEALVYDTVNFLSAVGGNLGLFVGFSCLSVIFTLIDCFKPLLDRLISAFY